MPHTTTELDWLTGDPLPHAPEFLNGAPPLTHRVFVYGTLKRGQHLWTQLLKDRPDVSFVREDIVIGYALAPAWPGCHWVPKAFAQPQGLVRGEVFTVSSERLQRLDRVELAYQRVVVTTERDQLPAYMYVARKTEQRPVKTYESFPFPREEAPCLPPS